MVRLAIDHFLEGRYKGRMGAKCTIHILQIAWTIRTSDDKVDDVLEDEEQQSNYHSNLGACKEHLNEAALDNQQYVE